MHSHRIRESHCSGREFQYSTGTKPASLINWKLQILASIRFGPAADPEYWTMVQTVRSAFQKAEMEIQYGTTVQKYHVLHRYIPVRCTVNGARASRGSRGGARARGAEGSRRARRTAAAHPAAAGSAPSWRGLDRERHCSPRSVRYSQHAVRSLLSRLGWLLV